MKNGRDAGFTLDQLSFLSSDDQNFSRVLAERKDKVDRQIAWMQKIHGEKTDPSMLIMNVIESSVVDYEFYKEIESKTRTGTTPFVKGSADEGHIYFMQTHDDRKLTLARVEKRQDRTIAYLHDLDKMYQACTGKSLLLERYPEIVGQKPSPFPRLTDVVAANAPSLSPVRPEEHSPALPDHDAGGLPALYWRWRNKMFAQELGRIESNPLPESRSRDLKNMRDRFQLETDHARKTGCAGQYSVPSAKTPEARYDLAARLNEFISAVDDRQGKLTEGQGLGVISAAGLHRAVSPTKTTLESQQSTGIMGFIKNLGVKPFSLTNLFNGNGAPAKENTLRRGLTSIWGLFASNDSGFSKRKKGAPIKNKRIVNSPTMDQS